jgi:hypothetical protein
MIYITLAIYGQMILAAVVEKRNAHRRNSFFVGATV